MVLEFIAGLVLGSRMEDRGGGVSLSVRAGS